MDRIELGQRLQEWHYSSSDPVYAVGSFYFAGKVYPKKEIVEDCIINLTKDLNRFKNEPTSKYNDLLIQDLEEIISGVEAYMKEDYKNG